MAFGIRATCGSNPLRTTRPLSVITDLDDAAILAAADACHQATPAQAIDEPRDVWVARDHSVSDLTAGHSGRIASP